MLAGWKRIKYKIPQISTFIQIHYVVDKLLYELGGILTWEWQQTQGIHENDIVHDKKKNTSQNVM